MAQPSISLVVPIHGQLSATRRFLESFERQTVRCPLLFVDDASPDESVEWLRAHGYPVEVPSHRLWFNGILNRAVQRCEAEILGFLNNDLVLGRRFVEWTVEAFERSGYDVLVPLTVEGTDPAELDRDRPYRVATLWRQKGWCMLFRTARVRELPPIPEDLKLWYGDTWLFHHAWQRRFRVGVMTHNRIFHEQGRSIRSAQAAHPRIVEDGDTYRTKYDYLRKKHPVVRWIPRPLRRLVLPYY